MRHHYVPQFLLAQWKDSDNLIQEFRIDLPQISTRRRATKQSCYVDSLYALSRPSVAGVSKDGLETGFFKRVDSDAAGALAKIATKDLGALTDTERCSWVRFLMSLRTRQPETVNWFKRESAECLRQAFRAQPEEYEILKREGDEPTLEEAAEAKYPGLIENFGLTFFGKAIDNVDIGNTIMQMRWWLWKFDDASLTLLLSDNPCIFTGPINARELIIALPISPKMAFMATRGEGTEARLRQINPKLLAALLNESSVKQARSRVYAFSASPLHFIEKHRSKDKIRA